MIKSKFSCSGRWEALISLCLAEGLHFASWDFAVILYAQLEWGFPACLRVPSRYKAVSWKLRKLTFIPQDRLSPWLLLAHFRNLVSKSKSPLFYPSNHSCLEKCLSTVKLFWFVPFQVLSSLSKQQRRFFLWKLLPCGHLSSSQKAPAGLLRLPLSTPVHSEGQGRNWYRSSCASHFTSWRPFDSLDGRELHVLLFPWEKGEGPTLRNTVFPLSVT